MTEPSPKRLLLFGAGVLGLLTVVGIASSAEQFSSDDSTPGTRNVLPIEEGILDSGSDNYVASAPIEIPRPIMIAVAIIVLLGVLYLLSRQRFSLRFRRPTIRFGSGQQVAITEDEQAEAIADFARDLIDELRAGDSPRYAIQRAYAAVETGFGAKELARKPAETPLRYLGRIFGQHATIQEPLAQLTKLFQQARYSQDPVTETMRTTAIDALRRIRDHYTAIAWNKIEALESAP